MAEAKLKARSTQSTYQTHKFQKICKHKTLCYSLAGSERYTLLPSDIVHPHCARCTVIVHNLPIKTQNYIPKPFPKPALTPTSLPQDQSSCTRQQ